MRIRISRRSMLRCWPCWRCSRLRRPGRRACVQRSHRRAGRAPMFAATADLQRRGAARAHPARRTGRRDARAEPADRRPQRHRRMPAAPARTDADCAVQGRRQLLWHFARCCVNKDTPTFPEQVKAKCAKDGRVQRLRIPTRARCRGAGRRNAKASRQSQRAAGPVTLAMRAAASSRESGVVY